VKLCTAILKLWKSISVNSVHRNKPINKKNNYNIFSNLSAKSKEYKRNVISHTLSIISVTNNYTSLVYHKRKQDQVKQQILFTLASGDRRKESEIH
jgi:hypothetical protein